MTHSITGFRVLDPEFERLVDTSRTPRVLFQGMTWAEGPAFDATTGDLYFSDVPRNVLYRRTTAGVRSFRRPSRFANGNTIDADGNLITCEQQTRCLSRTDRKGVRSILIEKYRGARLNSPNDVVVHSDGSIWFTDPDYGIRSESQGGIAPRELDGCFVFRYSPWDGELRIVATDLEMPNGLAFSPDESVLYVADSAFTEDRTRPRHVRAYDIKPGGELRNSRVLVEIDAGWPDGLRTDSAGRLWCAAGDGVRCYSPDGRELGTVLLPEIAANLCFATIEGSPSMVVTATSTLYCVALSPDRGRVAAGGPRSRLRR